MKKLTPEYIEERFDEYNSLYFEGKLTKSFEFVVSRGVKTWGSVRFIRGSLNIIKFMISKNVPWEKNPKELEDTILHEMIHVYELQILKVNQDHGAEFQKKMNEINSFGHNVSIRGGGEIIRSETKGKYIRLRNSSKEVIAFPANSSFTKIYEKLIYTIVENDYSVTIGEARFPAAYKKSVSKVNLYRLSSESLEDIEFLSEIDPEKIEKSVCEAEAIGRELWEARVKNNLYIVSSAKEPKSIRKEDVLINLNDILMYGKSIENLLKYFELDYIKSILGIETKFNEDDRAYTRYSKTRFQYQNGKIRAVTTVRNGYSSDAEVFESFLNLTESIFFDTYNRDYKRIVLAA